MSKEESWILKCNRLQRKLELAEAQLLAAKVVIHNIETCCSIRSVTTFLDRYHKAILNPDDDILAPQDVGRAES
jgi:hypothetical protein